MEGDTGAAIFADDTVVHAGDLQILRCVPGEFHAVAVFGEGVHVFLVARGYHIEDPGAIAFVNDRPQSQDILDEGHVDHHVGAIGKVIRRADRLHACRRRHLERIRVHLVGDIADRAAHVAFAIERALGTLQHLHPFHVEQRSERLRLAARVVVGHRNVVQVDPYGRAAVSRRRDAAHGQKVQGLRTRAVRQSWNRLVERLNVFDALDLDILRGGSRNSDRGIHQSRVAVGCGNDNLLDFVPWLVVSILCCHGARCGQRDHDCGDGCAQAFQQWCRLGLIHGIPLVRRLLLSRNTQHDTVAEHRGQPGTRKQDVNTLLKRVLADQGVGGLVTDHVVREHQRQVGLLSKLHERGVHRLLLNIEVELLFDGLPR